MSTRLRWPFVIVTLVSVVSLLLACAPATPQIIEKEVVRTVIVEKEVPVEKKVVETVIVEKPVVQTIVVEKVVTPTPVAGAKRGGKLVLGTTGDIMNFDAFMLAFISYPVFHQLYDRLIMYDHTLHIMPRLATSWEMNPEGTKLTLKLREGVKWHNGREFVADDVVKNFERALEPSTGSNIHGKVQNVAGAKAIDKYTVEINFKSPTPNMFDILNEMSIMAPESFGELDKTAIGTGPFKLKEWIPGDHVTLVRNENYWELGADGKPLPYLDEIVLKPYADLEALVTAVETGIIDGAISVPARDYKRLKDAGVIVEFGQTGATMYSITVNPPDPDQPKGPLSDKRVRQALNFALDRETIVAQALHGVGYPTQVPFPEFSLAYFEEFANLYPFDLEKAKKLLAEAGYPNGGFELKGITPAAYPELTDMAQIFAADLAKLGIKLKIEPLDSAVYATVRWGKDRKDYPGSGDYDLDFTFIGRSHLDPLGLFDNSPYRHYQSAVFPRGDFPAGYVEALTEAGATVDKEKRRELFRKVQQIMSEECINLPVSWRYTLFAHQSYVKGMDWSVGDEIILRYTWLDR